MSVLVGTAQAVLEVPVGTPMSGYAARTGPSTGVADPVTVRALVLDRAALVTVDVCGLHERTVELVAARLPDGVETPVLAATHTHAGPCVTFERLGSHDEGVHERLVETVVDVVRRAAAGRRACTVHHGVTPPLGVASNRRHPTRADDPPASFLRFDDGGRTHAWLVAFPCHPVVLDAGNRLVSGDFPAHVRQHLEAATPGALCLAATGAGGDMNPGRHGAEASFEADTTGLRTVAEARRVGSVIAQAVLAAPTREVAAASVSVAVEPVELPIDRTGPDQARRELAGWRAELARGVSRERAALLETWAAWAEQLLATEHDELPDVWRGSVTAVGLGPLALVALPGEPFLATAERIERAAGHQRPVLVLGYANGCPGYVPSAEEYPHGGYEVVDAHRYYAMPGPFAAGGAERLEAAAAQAIDRLWG